MAIASYCLPSASLASTSGFEREKAPCETANAISSSATLPAFSLELQDKKLGRMWFVCSSCEIQICKHEMLGCDNGYQGFFQGRGRGGISPLLGFGLPPLEYAGNSISHVNQFNDTITGELCLCKTAPDSTKLCLSKGPKSKFPRGSMPRTPLVRHMLCTRICACPPNNPYNLILLPLEQKAERNPDYPHYVMRWHMWNWCVECVYMCVRLCRCRYVYMWGYVWLCVCIKST